MLIVDDHCIVAEGIGLVLGRHDDIEVVGVRESAAEVPDAVDALRPDVILMDYRLGPDSGAQAAGAARARRPETAVVMMSGEVSDIAMLAALEAGASGFLLKTMRAEELVSAIRRAAAGEMLVPPGTVQRLLRFGREQEASTSGRARMRDSLTAREREVLALMGRGLDNAAIAEALTVSYFTVRGHVRAILEKLGARTKLEAVARARAEGLLDA